MQSSERNILTVSCFGHFLSHYNMLSFTPLLLPLTLSMQLELAEVLELTAMMYSLFGLSALLWGPLADRVGARVLFATYFAGAGVCGIGAAFSTSDPIMFKYCLAGLGLFSGVHHPVALGLITKGVKRVSVGMGYHGMAGNLGLALGPFASGLLNWGIGVQGAYIAVGLLNFAGLALLMRLQLPEEPRDEHLEAVEPVPHYWSPFLYVLFILLLGGTVYRMTTVILPALVELRAADFFAYLGLDQYFTLTVLASTTVSIFYLFGMGAQYWGGRIGERFDKRYAYLAFNLTATPFALVTFWLGGGWLLLASFLFMSVMVGYQPVENTLVGNLTPPRLRYSAFGVKCASTFGVGGFAVWLAGVVEKGHGIQSVLPAAGIFTLCAAVFIVGLIVLTNKMYNKTLQAG